MEIISLSGVQMYYNTYNDEVVKVIADEAESWTHPGRMQEWGLEHRNEREASKESSSTINCSSS